MYWFVVRPDMVNLCFHDTYDNKSVNFEPLLLHTTEFAANSVQSQEACHLSRQAELFLRLRYPVTRRRPMEIAFRSSSPVR